MTAPAAAPALEAGAPVTPFVLALSLQRMVMEAAVNRDFSPLHTDPLAGRAAGAPDAFANGTFIETILEAALRRWAGPDMRLKVLEYAMLSFNCAGDTITAGGAVTAVEGSRVEVDVWIDGPRGRTVSGVATLAFSSG